MLRFHKFTIGNAWISDYGNPDEEEHFRNLIRFSPLHNIPDSSNITGYPATLVLTGDPLFFLESNYQLDVIMLII